MSVPHLNLDTIAALIEGRLSGREKEEAEAHLATSCSRCREAAAEIGSAVHALRTYALSEVPPVVVEATLARLAERREGLAAAHLVKRAARSVERVAALVFDTWANAAAAAAGIRSGAVAPVRQLVYEWQNDRFTVHVQRERDDAPFVIRGRIFLTDGGVDGLVVHLESPTARTKKTKTETTGEFAFEGVRRGGYVIRIEAPGGDVILGGIELH